MLAVSSLILSPVACFGAQASAEKAYERSRPGASPDECASAVGRPVRSVVRCLALFSFLYVAYARWILDRPVTSTEIVFVGSVASMQAFWNDESTPPRLERTVVAAVAFVFRARRIVAFVLRVVLRFFRLLVVVGGHENVSCLDTRERRIRTCASRVGNFRHRVSFVHPRVSIGRFRSGNHVHGRVSRDRFASSDLFVGTPHKHVHDTR